MNINEYSVSELNNDELLVHNGGMIFFLTGVIIGMTLRMYYRKEHPYGD